MLKKLKYYIQYIGIKRSLERNPNQAIVMIDGGICSQIHQWRIGEALRARGVDVEYDILWFKICGKDINRKFVRNFDLLRAFPNIEFRAASKAKIKYFKKHFAYNENTDGAFINAKTPRYFGYYYPSYYQDLLPFKYTITEAILDDYNKNVAKQIKKENTQSEFMFGVAIWQSLNIIGLYARQNIL